MKKIIISDSTLCAENEYSFREKLETARKLERLTVDVIELPAVSDPKTDVLLVRTVSSFVKNAVLSVGAGADKESIDLAASALCRAEKSMIRIELPLSPVGMEYTGKRKPSAMLEWIGEAVAYAKTLCSSVEFCALDATRAEAQFLSDCLKKTAEAGADSVCVCDSAAVMLPDEFAAFTGKAVNDSGVPVSVYCSDKNGLACASAVMAVKAGAAGVKTGIGCGAANLETFAAMVQNLGDRCGFSTGLRYTELNRVIKQLERITPKQVPGAETAEQAEELENIQLCATDSSEAIVAAAEKLGYYLSDNDSDKLCAEVRRMAEKKAVGAKELDAIIASIALQAAPTYELKTFVVNNGNIFQSSAQITLLKDGKELTGISVGNGPVDAAFKAIDQITGVHYELDDFQIQSVTEGKEAVGSAIVKLRSRGRIYSGNGISTDIVGAGIRAYIAAVNRIIYEEDK